MNAIDGKQLVTVDAVAAMFAEAMSHTPREFTDNIQTVLDQAHPEEVLAEQIKWYQAVADAMNRLIQEGKDPHSLNMEQLAFDQLMLTETPDTICLALLDPMYNLVPDTTLIDLWSVMSETDREKVHKNCIDDCVACFAEKAGRQAFARVVEHSH